LRDLMSLAGRTCVVTGGAGHIGAVVADGMAELGADIAIVDLAQDRSAAVAEGIGKKWGHAATSFVTNLEHDDPRGLVAKIHKCFGRIDVVVNCGAFVGTSELAGWAVAFEQQSVETWRRALEVNLTAPFALVQAAAEHLRASGHGSIINMASIYGLLGPDWGLYEGTKLSNPAAYGASKGGLIQLTRWLATTLAPDVRVNAIAPGGVLRNTPEPFLSRYVARTPLGRMATEEDIKGAVAYLASDLSAYVTGQCIAVDGGWTAW
jgi:NAD(P)-dependent dehydrogenase (short-subunit alcohol dehydrogenase family)